MKDLDRVYRDHGHAVLRRARRLLRNEEDARDVDRGRAMKRALLLALMACNSPPVHKLPGAPVGPIIARPPARACATEVHLEDQMVLRYLYTYDGNRLVHAHGVYTHGGTPASLDYSYDNLDHMTELVEQHAWGDTMLHVTVQYDSLGDMVEYAYEQRSAHAHEKWRYTYASFNDDGQATRQTYSTDFGSTSLTLDYDNAGRIIRVTPETGDPTLYTYDDDGKTLTIDNGGYHGTILYDDDNHELSETWDGTGEGVYATQDVYEWSGDRLLSVTHRSGSEAAPHELRTTEVDVHRYDCASQ